MATAQLLTLTHGVDSKVNDIGDTVKVVCLYGQTEKEMKSIVEQTARETTAIMQLMENKVDEAKRS